MTSFGFLLPTRGIVQSTEDNATLAERTQRDVMALAERAETLGYDAVWVGDSVLARPRLEPLTTLAAVAGATERIELGTAVYLSVLRQPANVAHLTATVDQLSGGRLSLGLGAGSANPSIRAEHANLDAPFEGRGAALNELLGLVTDLWAGETVTHDGEFYQLDEANLGFGPVEKPPIYVPTGSFDSDRGFPKRIHERLVEYGDGAMPNVIPPERYAESVAAIESLLENAGRDPSAFDHALYVDAVIDEDADAAWSEARQFFDHYYGEGAISDEAMAVRGMYGPPAEVAERLDAYTEAGVETVIVRFTAREQAEQVERFAELL